MGKPADSVRFMDEFDFTVSLDSRTTNLERMTSIEINTKPIVFRASYRDINFMTDIVNRASTAYAQSQSTKSSGPDDTTKTVSGFGAPSTYTKPSEKSRAGPVGKATVVMTREQVSQNYKA